MATGFKPRPGWPRYECARCGVEFWAQEPWGRRYCGAACQYAATSKHDRDAALWRARKNGATYRQCGAAFGITLERARQIVKRVDRRLLAAADRELAAATATAIEARLRSHFPGWRDPADRTKLRARLWELVAPLGPFSTASWADILCVAAILAWHDGEIGPRRDTRRTTASQVSRRRADKVGITTQ